MIVDRIKAHGGEVKRHRWHLVLKRGRISDAALEWLKQPHIREALMHEIWPAYDAWAERAAIREYDGGQGRDEAEAAAYAEVGGC